MKNYFKIKLSQKYTDLGCKVLLYPVLKFAYWRYVLPCNTRGGVKNAVEGYCLTGGCSSMLTAPRPNTLRTIYWVNKDCLHNEQCMGAVILVKERSLCTWPLWGTKYRVYSQRAGSVGHWLWLVHVCGVVGQNIVILIFIH